MLWVCPGEKGSRRDIDIPAYRYVFYFIQVSPVADRLLTGSTTILLLHGCTTALSELSTIPAIYWTGSGIALPFGIDGG